MDNLEIQLWQKPEYDDIRIKIRVRDSETGRKKGVVLAMTEEVLLALMGDVAEGQEYEIRRIWFDGNQLIVR